MTIMPKPPIVTQSRGNCIFHPKLVVLGKACLHTRLRACQEMRGPSGWRSLHLFEGNNIATTHRSAIDSDPLDQDE